MGSLFPTQMKLTNSIAADENENPTKYSIVCKDYYI